MQIWRYAIATLTPLACLLLAAAFGGWWAAGALIWLTLFAGFLDHILAPPGPGSQHSWLAEALSVTLASGHLLLLALTCFAFASPDRSWPQTITLFLGLASFMGQVSHPNAHELIHRNPRALRRLGAAVYISMLFGHHVSAHRLVHHAYVGTPDDPNTPRPNQSFWAFLPRAWVGSFKAGLAQENRRQKSGKPRAHPYALWVGGGALCLIIAPLIGGIPAVTGFLGLAVLAHCQILLSDYIQHYGLSRLTLPNGRIEPVGPMHSWNAPRAMTSFMMVNAPSHSDHHMHPDHPYTTLKIPPGAPILPWSMPVMALLATMPRHWHRIMDKRAAKIMTRARQDQKAHIGKGTLPP